MRNCIDGYVRVSQVRGREGASFISPELQKDRIRSWARHNGYEVAVIHEELDQSGARADRPLLLRALARIERREAHGLVVARLDRLGRSLVDGLGFVERIQRAGGVFASVNDGFDLTTDTGRLVLRIMLSLAEFELERVRSGFEDARARAVARGIHPSPVPPFGYQRSEDRDGRILGPLQADPVTGPLVSEVFLRRAAGTGFSDLCRLLEEAGAVGAYGHARWTPRTVKAMVRNRVYLGEARHGKYTNDGAHVALTDAITWGRAQRRGNVSPARSGDRPALLAGLIRCAGCRYGMGSYLPRGAGGNRQYRCHKVYPAGRCPEPASISTSTGLEAFVVDAFFARVGRMAAAPTADDDSLADLDIAVDEAREALRIFRDDPRIIAALGEDAFVDGLVVRRQALDAAVEALAESELGGAGGLPPVTELRELWTSLDVRERRKLLCLAIESVFVRRGRGDRHPLADFVYISWRGEGIEVPGRGTRSVALLPPLANDSPPNPGMPTREELQEGALDVTTNLLRELRHPAVRPS